MRLHRLEVSGFGPFAGHEIIDFDEVVRHGLFLLHGQTGAGKSSLLDAICFALFGSVPGTRSQTERLTSDHAAGGVRPQVVAEFTASGRRLKVTRSPAWDRPKSRGTGTTRDKPQVFVQEWIDNGWVARAQRADEAGQVLSDALGMGKDQFTKVILLPQGDFAAFLRASPDDRRTLLEKLFGTVRFGNIEEWLANARSAAKAQLQEADGRRSDLIARADERAASIPGIDRSERLALAALPPDAVGDASVALLTGWHRRAADIAAAADASAAAAAEADRRARADAEHVTGRLHRASTLLRALHDHHGQLRAATARAATRERLDRAELAERVRSRLRSIEVAAAALRRASDAVERALGAIATITLLSRAQPPAAASTTAEPTGQLSFDIEDDPATGQPVDADDTQICSASTDLSPNQLDEEISARRTLIARIDEFAPQEAAALVADAAAVKHTERLHGLKLRRSELKAAIDDARQRLRGLGIERETLLPVAATRAERRAAGDRATTRRDAAVEVLRLRQAVEKATNHHQSCVDTAQSARTHHLGLVQRRLESMAAELASRLADGDACPVCGATEHPQPAEAARLVSADEVQAAGADADRLAEVAAAAASERAQLREQLSAAETEAGGLTSAQADERLRAAKLAVEDAEKAVHRIAELDEIVEAEQLAVGQAESELDRLGTQQEVVQGELSRLNAQVAESTRALAGLRGSFDTLAERRDALAQEQELLTTLARALDDERAARAACEKAQAEADNDCTTIGFTGRMEAAQALMDEPDRRGLTAELEVGTKAAAAAAARLTEDDLTAAAAEAGLTGDRLSESGMSESGLLDAELSGTDLSGSRFSESGRSGVGWPPGDVDAVAVAVARVTARHEDLAVLARSAEQAAAEREQEATDARALAAQVRPAAAAITALCGDLRILVDELAPMRERAAILDELASTAQGVSASNTRKLRLAAFVLEARLEQVAEAASLRLQHMSSGRYTLLHSESRGRGGGRSGLGLRVMDAWTSLPRDTASLSGGESFLASLALALGLADVVQAESGGIAIETLFIDEGFGTLDEDTLELVMEVLDQLREGGRAVGVVSHVGELRSRIPSQLQVVKGRRGSQVVVSQQLVS